MSEQVVGEALPGHAYTVLTFMDGSSLRVHWDGGYEVAMHASDTVTLYCPEGRRLYFPWHRIDRIEHQEAAKA